MKRVFGVIAAAIGCGSPSHAPAPDAPDSRPDAPDSRPDAPDTSPDAPDTPPDAPDIQPDEPLPDPSTIAGPLTLASWGAQPFLSPAPVPEVLQSSFSIGREFFIADWLPAPNAQRPNLDGLGPLYDAPACLSCHPATGRAPSLRANGTVAPALLFRLARTGGGADPVFGGALQTAAIAGVAPEASVTYAVVSGRPVFAFATSPDYGALDPDTRTLPRLAPQLAGMGLLEAVPDAAIVAREDPLDLDGDGVSGRAARLSGGAIGRFGWKAVQPALRDQAAAAFAGDMGITSATHADDCTASQPACLAQPSGGAPEIAAVDVDAVASFARYLGVPRARRDNADAQIARGYALFYAAGCERCHAQTLVTATSATSLSAIAFHPYTDLLLHDMGADLADALGEGDASPAEWRTPPLWGLGLVAADPSARFLHDGRAATLADAIRAHGGEGERARARFDALSPADRDALLAFLESL